MKQVVWGFFIAVICLAIILIILTIAGRMQRSTEVNSTLSEAVEQSVNTVMNNKTYTVTDKDEFVADVLQNLINSYESNGQITVKIATADEEKGLLGIRVIEKFTKANGQETEETFDKVVLLETDESSSTYTVTYLTDEGAIFQKISLNGGDKISLPKLKPEGCTGWAIQNDDGTYTEMTDEQIASTVIGKNTIFKAY